MHQFETCFTIFFWIAFFRPLREYVLKFQRYWLEMPPDYIFLNPASQKFLGEYPLQFLNEDFKGRYISSIWNLILLIFLGEHAPEILRHWLEMPPNYTSLNPVFQNVLGKHFSQLIIWILKAAILHHFESYANFYGRACPKFPRHWFEMPPNYTTLCKL